MVQVLIKVSKTDPFRKGVTIQEKTCHVCCKGEDTWSLLHICLGGHCVKRATGPAAEDGRSVLATVG